MKSRVDPGRHGGDLGHILAAGKGLPAGGGVEASEAHVRGRQRQGWYAGGKDERN